MSDSAEETCAETEQNSAEKEKKKMKIAVITGASSGMGQEFAKQIDKKCLGLDEIWLIARRKNLMEELADELTVPVRVIDMDLADDPSYANLIHMLEKEKPQVRVAVNCAGFGKTGPFTDISLEDNLGMIDLNCRALTKMTYLLLPYMPKRSYLIQVASVAGILPQPNFAVYAASKSYVLSFSRALGRELWEKGIYVTSVCPGPVDTPFFEIAERTGTTLAIKKFTMVDVTSVVSKALRDSYYKRSLSVCSLPIKSFRLLAKVLPHEVLLSIVAQLKK